MRFLLLTNDVPLIGDFLGTIPAMIALSKTVTSLSVIHRPEVAELFNMIPKRYHIGSRQYDVRDRPSDLTIRVGAQATDAYWFAHSRGLHMTQAHFHYVGLPIPNEPVRPELMVPAFGVPNYDYVIAPFSVSLPSEQLWPQERWNELVNRMPNHSFAVIGHGYRDDRTFISAPNVTPEFGHSFARVSNILTKARVALISVVTGISHLAHALGVPNVLLENQDTPWGINPEAMRIHSPVTKISVDEVIDRVHQVASRKEVVRQSGISKEWYTSMSGLASADEAFGSVKYFPKSGG